MIQKKLQIQKQMKQQVIKIKTVKIAEVSKLIQKRRKIRMIVKMTKKKEENMNLNGNQLIHQSNKSILMVIFHISLKVVRKEKQITPARMKKKKNSLMIYIRTNQKVKIRRNKYQVLKMKRKNLKMMINQDQMKMKMKAYLI